MSESEGMTLAEMYDEVFAERDTLRARVQELETQLAECESYLKEGETPAQCIQRNRDDAGKALKLFADERIAKEELGAKVPKWVSVEDGLPEENENVWISAISPQSGERFYADGMFYGGRFYIFDTMTDESDFPVDPDYWQHITPPEDSSDE